MNLKLKKRRIKNKEIIIGCTFIIIGISIIICNLLHNKVNKIQELKKVDEFIEIKVVDTKKQETIDNNTNLKQQSTENYIAVIEIPKIYLKKGIYSKTSVLNDVDRNIQILKESSFPDEENGNVILAAHSGIGKNAYFSNLEKLKKEDVVNIYYNNILYEYRVENIYEVTKTGTIELENYSSSILTLITCNQNDKTKQIVFICKQTKKGK